MKKYINYYCIVMTILSLLSIYLNYNLYSMIELLLEYNKEINDKIDLNMLNSDHSLSNISPDTSQNMKEVVKNNDFYWYSFISLLTLISIGGIGYYIYQSGIIFIQPVDLPNNIDIINEINLTNTISIVRDIPNNRNNDLIEILTRMQYNFARNDEVLDHMDELLDNLLIRNGV